MGIYTKYAVVRYSLDLVTLLYKKNEMGFDGLVEEDSTDKDALSVLQSLCFLNSLFQLISLINVDDAARKQVDLGILLGNIGELGNLLSGDALSRADDVFAALTKEDEGSK